MVGRGLCAKARQISRLACSPAGLPDLVRGSASPPRLRRERHQEDELPRTTMLRPTIALYVGEHRELLSHARAGGAA